MKYPDCEISYEYDNGDWGSVLAYNFHGHGLDIDMIEAYLDENEEDEEFGPQEWEVREDYLRVVPANDGARHVYSGKGRGARAVTVAERSHGWAYWCFKHPLEPAQSGIPASQIIGGEELVTERLAALEEPDDPRRDVERYRENDEGYVYMCRECSNDHSERFQAAVKLAVQQAREQS